jgi:tetratricopeptide (TPR) repeat protein
LLTYTRAIRAAFSGDAARALAEVTAAGALYESTGNQRRACNMRMLAALSRLHLGDNAGAVAALEPAIIAAMGMGLHNVEALGRQVLGIALARTGRMEEGFEEERISAEMFAEQGDRRLEGTSRRYLAQIHLLNGDVDAASAEAEQAVDLLGALPPSLVAGLAVLAQVRIQQGRAAEALAVAARGAEILAELGTVPDGAELLAKVQAMARELSGL